MTKKIDETLKKTSISKKKTSFKITKKNPSKITKKVILETPILEQISDKKTKRTVVKKRPEHKKAVGSLNVVKNTESIKPLIVSVPPKAQKIETKKVKKSHTSLKPVTPKKHSQKNSRMLNTQQILIKPKRNLKLHLENTITSEEEEQINSILNFENVPAFEASSLPKKEVTINQNSSFFYEPSIFEKFNIEISKAGEDSKENVTNVQDKNVTTEDTTTTIEENLENNSSNEDFDFVSDSIPEELQNSVEDNSEYDFISTETPNIYNSNLDSDNLSSELEETTPSQENNESQELVLLEKTDEISNANDDTNINDEKIVDINDILDISDISLDDINLDDISLEDIENIDNLIEADFSNEELVKESADNVVKDEILDSTEVKSDSDDSAIGKFFDSSIPTINNTDDSYFTKIKKSLFSNISTVFKKFSYEEASLVTSENEAIEEASPIINETQVDNNSDILQVLGNFDNEETTIKNLEISAEPNTLVIPSVDEKVLEAQEISDNENQDIYTNVITPQSTNDIEDISLDDIDINDIDIPEIKTFVNSTNADAEQAQDSFNDFEELSEEEIDRELDEVLGLAQEEETVEEEQFSIEEYFGVTPKQQIEENDDEYILEDDEDNLEEEPIQNEQDSNIYQEQMQTFSKLIENFTQTISTLSNKITELESNISAVQNPEPDIHEETEVEILDDSSDTSNQISNEDNLDEVTENNSTELEGDEVDLNNISLDDISLDDISLDDISLEDLESLEETNDNEPSLLPIQDESSEDIKSVEDILLEAFDNPNIDDQMKQDLLSEVLSVEEDLKTPAEDTSIQTQKAPVETEATSDFFKIIDSLSKTISELENAPEEVATLPETSDKAINILINKDDIFSIAISNETYEIVTDFDGISVLSENIHISTPKNNFYVNIGEKYIEIHKQPDLFVVNTNFEDIEFANAINNITFAKKKNKIELNIKEAFKISSVNKKIELSMLNTSIANLAGVQEKSDSDSSICDNKTLVINEETQKVYLPYTIEEVMKKLNNSSDYQSLEDVVEQEYTLPLSTFKMPIISRFKEAYKFMREKEKSSVYAALDLAVELMFNSNLNPAVIRASKDLKELNIYLDCLYENELEKFDCFKIVYKVLPKIQS